MLITICSGSFFVYCSSKYVFVFFFTFFLFFFSDIKVLVLVFVSSYVYFIACVYHSVSDINIKYIQRHNCFQNKYNLAIYDSWVSTLPVALWYFLFFRTEIYNFFYQFNTMKKWTLILIYLNMYKIRYWFIGSIGFDLFLLVTLNLI